MARRIYRGLLCAAIVASMSATAARAAEPTTKKVALNDGWLVQACIDEFKIAGEKGDFEGLRATMESALVARLACGGPSSLDGMAQMVATLEGCQYMAMLAKIEGHEKLSKELQGNRDLSRLLFRALEDCRSPQEALANMVELFNAEEKAVPEYANLAVAFATTQPLMYYVKQPTPASLVESFRYYTNGKAKFRYDVKAMPYELARYLADTRLSLAERQWAQQNYSNNADPGKAYFDLVYDIDHFREGKPKKISKLDFTLPNLKKVGGVCIEQAYYATEICKALGIPATIVYGQSNDNIGHAWAACLKLNKGEAIWDAQTGRYPEMKFFVGTVHDPATQKFIKDCELTLVGLSSLLPLQRREEADAAVVLARMVDVLADKSPKPDPAALAKLAEAYNARQGPTKAKADVSLMTCEGKINTALACDLLVEAVERNLAHRPAWDLVLDLRTKDRLPASQLERVFDILVSRTAKDFPDYSCSLVMRIIPTMTEPATREQVYEKMLPIYGKRQDLQGQIMIAAGDEMHKQDKNEKAYAIYEKAALQNVDLSIIVLPAATKAEQVLVQANHKDKAVDLYEKLFAKASRPTLKGPFRAQTTWYQLGQRLSSLLGDTGNERRAKDILRQIEG